MRFAFSALTAAASASLLLAVACTAAPKAAAKAAAKPDLPLGRSVYTRECAACHGPDGKPAVPNSPDFSLKSYQKSVKDAQLTKATLDGGKTMPPFKGKLKPAEVPAVVAYVRTLGKK